MTEPAVESKFEDLLSHPHLLEGLKDRLGFSSPTKIQSSAMPPVLEGHNVFAGAKTGSGKTIAFLAPIAQRILENKARMALILAPTRELVLQIDEEAEKLLRGQNEAVSIPLFGGVPVDPQVLALRIHKPRIIIATPGRIFDVYGEGVLKLDEVDIIVLDEADRMCDMGFAPQVNKIFDLCPNIKQTLCFSATLPPELSGVMDRYCTNPVKIQVDPSDKSSETINHKVIFTHRRDKISTLLELVKSPEVTSLIFVRTRTGADRLYSTLKNSTENMSLGILHAGYEMPEREATLRAFKEGHIRTLIATDVAARGIDVEHLTHVVHFDLAEKLDDYIHRSGRSGRAGRSGTTYALIDQDDPELMARFKEFSQKVNFEFVNQPPSNQPQERGSRHPSGRRHPRDSRRDGPRDNRERHPRSHQGSGEQRRHSSSRDGARPHHSPRRDDTRPHAKQTKPQQAQAAHSPKKQVSSTASKIKSWIKDLFG